MTSNDATNQDVFTQLVTMLDHDPYMNRCIHEVRVPRLFIQLFEGFFVSEIWTKQIKTIGKGITLLQMSIEMHRQVTIERLISTSKKRVRQQAVLAGDYYSSLFYRLFASKQEIRGIRFFSQVIESIHRANVSFHKKGLNQSVWDQEMIHFLQTITSGLLVSVPDFFQMEDDFTMLWKRVVADNLLIQHLEDHQLIYQVPYAERLQVAQSWVQSFSALSKHLEQSDQANVLGVLAVIQQQEPVVRKLTVKES